MKALKQDQLGPWCSFCSAKTTKAVLREDGFRGKFACALHKEDLRCHEVKQRTNRSEMSEAEYQIEKMFGI